MYFTSPGVTQETGSVQYTKGIIVFKCINKMTPLCMTNLFTPLTQICKTRQSTDMCMILKVLPTKKECYANCFAVNGTIIWNNLNAQLRTLNSLTIL